jgi:hypothetical protein
MAVVQPIHQQDPVQALAARLDDPQVAAALHRLLDHVDLLSILALGLSELVSRGETISDSLASGVSDLREANLGAGFPPPGEIGVLLQRLLTLTGPVTDSLPTVEKLLTSGLGDPRVIDTASMASRAVVRVTEGPAPAPVTGIRALLRALKDDDVSRALGWVLAIAKNLGQELRQARR